MSKCKKRLIEAVAKCLRAEIKKKHNIFIHLGPVVQSIVSLTKSLRSQHDKYMPTKLSNPLSLFVEKNVRIFCSAKDSHIFQKKKKKK